MDSALCAHWEHAVRIDGSLALRQGQEKTLASRRIQAERYSRSRLFRALLHQSPILFRDFPTRVPLNSFFDDGQHGAVRLKQMFLRSATTLVKLGRSQRRVHMLVHDVVNAWCSSRRILSANDVFFRELRLDRQFDCAALSDFNVIPSAPQWDIRRLEVATLLLGTPGAMSDSHSDDPDGCNHCVAGRKLWLVWDRREAGGARLQDCSYDYVTGSARFDMTTFLSLASARWFMVAAGETLFLPGHLTHKVITLERYLGISSFYVGLPNGLATLARWLVYPRIMVSDSEWSAIARLVANRLRSAAEADRAVKHRWGFYFMREACCALEARYGAGQLKRLRAYPEFAALWSEMAGC